MSRTLWILFAVVVVLYLLSRRTQTTPVATGVSHLLNPFAPPTTGTPPVSTAGPGAPTPAIVEAFPGSGVTVPSYGFSNPDRYNLRGFLV